MSSILMNPQGLSCDEELLRRAAETTLALFGPEEAVEMGITLADEEEIHRLNREFRNVDRATDVLSFPMIDYSKKHPHKDRNLVTGEVLLGDVVLCPAVAQRQGEAFGHGTQRELAYLTCHGTLHLLGYDHMEDGEKKEMRAAEKEIMRAMGLAVQGEEA